MAKWTIFLTICLFLALFTFFIVLSGVGIRKNSEISSPASPSPTANPSSLTLSLLPNTLNTQPNQFNTIDVVLDTQGVPPSLVQLEIAYDSRVITNIAIQPGNLVPNPEVVLNAINYQTGRISYAVQIPPQKLQATKGSIAILTFSVRSDTPFRETTIYFLPKTIVLTKEKMNGLEAAYGTTIQITSGSAITGYPKGQR